MLNAGLPHSEKVLEAYAMLFVRIKIFPKLTLKKVEEDLVCYASFVRINSKIFARTIFCSLKIFANLAKCSWNSASGRDRSQNFTNIFCCVKAQVERLKIVKMACRFLYLQENSARNSRLAAADGTLSMSSAELIKEFRTNREEIEEICELAKTKCANDGFEPQSKSAFVSENA